MSYFLSHSLSFDVMSCLDVSVVVLLSFCDFLSFCMRRTRCFLRLRSGELLLYWVTLPFALLGYIHRDQDFDQTTKLVASPAAIGTQVIENEF